MARRKNLRAFAASLSRSQRIQTSIGHEEKKQGKNFGSRKRYPDIEDTEWAARKCTYPAFHLLPAFSNSSASSKKSFSLTGFCNAHVSAEREETTINLLLDVKLSVLSMVSVLSILEPWHKIKMLKLRLRQNRAKESVD